MRLLPPKTMKMVRMNVKWVARVLAFETWVFRSRNHLGGETQVVQGTSALSWEFPLALRHRSPSRLLPTTKCPHRAGITPAGREG
jgi:hypothetical protein